MRLVVLLAVSAVALVAAAPASAQLIQQAEFTGGAGGQMLGSAVAISGTTIAVGVPGLNYGGNAGQGAVLVYTVNASGGWQPVAELTASDGASGDSLGSSVAIDGNTIVAGAPFHTAGGQSGQGAAYIFTMPSGGWQNVRETAELTASDGAANDNFGTSVGISGSNAVVGAPNHTVGANAGQGAVYVYSEGPSGGWPQATQTEFGQSGGASNDNFGAAVGIFGTTVVAGAPFTTVNGHASEGEAYAITEPSGGPWSGATESGLTASDGATGDNFGAAVAITGGTIGVGSPSHAVGGNAGQGAAYVFTQSSGAIWAQAATLTGSGGAAGDDLGTAVAISGGRLVAGAQYHGVGSNQYAGEGYVFTEASSGGWPAATQEGLTAADGATNDHLGTAVGVSGSTVVAGAPGHAISGGGANAGAVYVFGPGSSSNVPVSTGPPSITGTLLAGSTLMEAHGNWTNSPIAYSYQWEDCDLNGAACVPIPGATQSTYTLGAPDTGHTIVVQETAANLSGSGSPASSAATPVVHSGPVLTLLPTQIAVGPTDATLRGTASPGGLPTTVHYEYGLDPRYSGGGPLTYDESTPQQQLAASFGVDQVSATLTNLVPNATYHVRLVATNSAGTTYSVDQTFTTGHTPPPAPPLIGQSVDLTPVSGIVLIKLPATATGSPALDLGSHALVKGQGFVPLTEARQIPIGSQIDARRGTVVLSSATGTRTRLQSVTVNGGIFGLSQDRSGVDKGLTTLSLLEGVFPGAPSFAQCRRAAADTAPLAQATAVSSRILQTLRATDRHGRFRTKGHYSAATVRGTQWITEDRCDGTLTIVQRGVVDVSDFGLHRTIPVRAGHRYLARGRQLRH